MPTLFIADQDAAYRAKLRAELAQIAGVVVAGEAGGAANAEQAATRLQPDVLLLAVDLPPDDGAAMIRRLLGRQPRPRIIAMADRPDDYRIADLVRAGADACVLKDATDELARAIAAVLDGDALLSPAIAAHLALQFRAMPGA